MFNKIDDFTLTSLKFKNFCYENWITFCFWRDKGREILYTVIILQIMYRLHFTGSYEKSLCSLRCSNTNWSYRMVIRILSGSYLPWCSQGSCRRKKQNEGPAEAACQLQTADLSTSLFPWLRSRKSCLNYMHFYFWSLSLKMTLMWNHNYFPLIGVQWEGASHQFQFSHKASRFIVFLVKTPPFTVQFSE